MSKKPKAWRAFMNDSGGCGMHTHAPATKPYNCTVIPDGAHIPLPAHVRRLVRAALAWHENDPVVICERRLDDAVVAYRKAEAKRRGKR